MGRQALVLSPQIMFKARLQNNKEIIVDDYREAYVGWPRVASPDGP